MPAITPENFMGVTAAAGIAREVIPRRRVASVLCVVVLNIQPTTGM
jgi:hypothetical protein